MASTYTVNTGLEKIGSGEQSGVWGTTTNTNFDIVDRAINGVGSISLSGTTHTLTTTDGGTGATSSSTQTGRYSTLNNDHDATATESGDYTIVNRYNDNHRAYIKVDTDKTADIQILQDKEAQNIDVGDVIPPGYPEITIIQTD